MASAPPAPAPPPLASPCLRSRECQWERGANLQEADMRACARGVLRACAAAVAEHAASQTHGLPHRRNRRATLQETTPSLRLCAQMRAHIRQRHQRPRGARVAAHAAGEHNTTHFPRRDVRAPTRGRAAPLPRTLTPSHSLTPLAQSGGLKCMKTHLMGRLHRSRHSARGSRSPPPLQLAHCSLSFPLSFEPDCQPLGGCATAVPVKLLITNSCSNLPWAEDDGFWP